jgi:hypothetical protein
MKFTQLLLLAISCAALMPVTSYAAPSQQTSGASSTTDNSASQASALPHNDHPQDAQPAVSANDEKQRKEGTPYEKRTVGGASNQTHSRSHARLTAAQRPKQLPNGQKRSIAGNATNLHPPRSDKAGGLATGGFQNIAVNNAQHVQPTTLIRPNVASLNTSHNNVRHRGPNPAVIGGSAISNPINTGGISGTNMHRRP